MQVNYTVHSVSEEPVPVTATFMGREVTATVPGMTVELCSASESHTFRFVPTDDADLAAYRAMFVVDAAITATFTPTTA